MREPHETAVTRIDKIWNATNGAMSRFRFTTNWGALHGRVGIFFSEFQSSSRQYFENCEKRSYGLKRSD